MEEKKVLEIIRKRPGINSYQIGKMLNKRDGAIKSCLLCLERQGILIAEDNYGGLSLFKKNDT
jgi:hypothetical protein